MQWQSFIVNVSGLAIVLFYCLYRFNSPPPPRAEIAGNGSAKISTLRQWFHLRDPPQTLILPPPRANTTAFKFWLYRCVYAFIGGGIYLLVSRVPGLRDPLPAMIALFQLPDLPMMDLTNGVVLALLLVVLSRVPPLRGADDTIRRALYERASIPAHLLSFQFMLRGAIYLPDNGILESIRGDLIDDGFTEEDITYDAKAATRPLWTKVNLLAWQLEFWAQMDRYKTAFAVLREPDSDNLSVDRLLKARDALKPDARICLAALREHPHSESTLSREALFRQECKVLLDAIYCLISRVMLRSHFCHYDAITAVREAGFKVQVNATPLPNRNDLVALIFLFFLVITIPLAYMLGFYRAAMITVIYVLASVTPIYLAAEWPNLLRSEPRHMPPLAFPLLAAALASAMGILVGIVIGSVPTGKEAVWAFDISNGLTRWRTVSYPWTILIFFITAMLSVLMLVGNYPDAARWQGVHRYRRWANPVDGMILGMFTLIIMAVIVYPMLRNIRPDIVWQRVIILPVVAAVVIGLVVPTWYRGNRELIQVEVRRHAPQGQGLGS